jgi:hypothetical protein
MNRGDTPAPCKRSEYFFGSPVIVAISMYLSCSGLQGASTLKEAGLKGFELN